MAESTRCAAHRGALTSVLALAAALILPAGAGAQTPVSVRVTKRAVVLDTPRADGFVLGTVTVGEVLEVLDQGGAWYLVSTPDRMPLRRGWIQVGAVEVVGIKPRTGPPSRGMMIRGFAQAGGNVFAASHSFETILGTAFGAVYGGGGQIAFGNGGYIEGSVERFRKTGSRVLASGTRLYSLSIANDVTVTPVHATFGYREQRYGRIVPYLGAGLGWQTLQERSPSIEDARCSHVGFHIVGGAEIPLLPWVSIAGEAQRTVVPNVLGDTGASALFTEDDLGGAAFRFKVIVGR